VAEQHRASDPGGGERGRQLVERGAVQVVDAARAGRRVGAAVAGARVDQPGAAGRRAEPVGEVAPQRDRAQPLVQEDDRRPAGRGGVEGAAFEPGAGGVDEPGRRRARASGSRRPPGAAIRGQPASSPR
jgi:hypothetical protein